MATSIVSRARVGAALSYLAVFSLTACTWDVKDSTQVQQAGIYQSYTVTYDEPSRRLSATAQFTTGGAGGESIDLQSPSTVSFDGGPMQKDAFLGLKYKAESTVDFAPSHSFLYIDNNKKEYTNSVVLVPVGVDTVPEEVKASGDFTFTFDGAAKANGEEILVSFDVENGTTHTWTTRTAEVRVGSRTGKVHGTEFQQALPKGTGTFQIVRRKTATPQSSGGGSFTGNYYSAKGRIKVVD